MVGLLWSPSETIKSSIWNLLGIALPDSTTSMARSYLSPESCYVRPHPYSKLGSHLMMISAGKAHHVAQGPISENVQIRSQRPIQNPSYRHS